MRYLNNVIPGSNNTGVGTKAYPLNGTMILNGNSVANLTNGMTSEMLKNDFWYNTENAYPGWPDAVLLADYESPNVVGSEFNDFYTMYGMLEMASPFPSELSEANKTAYEQAGLRLPIKNHQAPCARTERTTIIKATSKTSTELQNYSQFDGIWDADYIDEMQEISDAHAATAVDANLLFGIHNVGCMYHSSGPCTRKDIENTITSGWSGNFSSGYVPMMDNNLMVWTPTLGPLLDAFLRDDIHFYPMRWEDNGDDGNTEIYSVLVNPCGLTLIEIASNDIKTGGARAVSATDFNLMPHKRAVLENSTIHTKDYRNEPLPLVPIRISRAVGTDNELMNKMLQFYGANKEDVSISSNLGFDSTVLFDESVDEEGRAVTLMLSESAMVHLQLWSRDEIDDSTTDFLNDETFVAAVGSNQINGGQPKNAQSFCTDAVGWTVDRYNKYVVKTHESTMAPSTTDGEPYNPASPPAGGPIDTLIDIHFSWSCTDPSCSIQKALQGFYDSGARAFNLAIPGKAFAYGYDPR